MNKDHEEYAEAYFDAIKFGSDDQIYNACVELEQFEREAFFQGLLKEEELIFKHVLIKD